MSTKQLVLVGTYTQPGKSKGIYSFLLDMETGVLEGQKESPGIVNPSWLTLNSALNRLYAVNELREYEGKSSGSISAFAFDLKTREMKLLNIRPTRGADPCHVVLNKQNTHVYVSNYSGGSVCVFPVLSNGSLGEASQLVQHEGSGVNKARQGSPHAHSLCFDPSGRFAFVPDLGIDRLMAYRADAVSGALEAAQSPYYKAKPGTGPRHCTFHPNGKYLYVINELGSSINTLVYNETDASLLHLQTVSTIPADFYEHNSCADIQITPDGCFLYGSNRGHNSIAIYSVDPGAGLLSLVDIESSRGKTPRSFCIDHSGAFLLAANQDSDNVVVFCVDRATGRLRKVSEHAVPTPVCVKTYELP
jgi:6-phosphogluconolactonase